MYRQWVLLALLVAAALLPLTAVLYAGPIPCCFGTTCPTYPGCTLSWDEPGPWYCKRLCTPPCSEGNKCCEFRYRTCHYTGGDCPPNANEIVGVTVYEYKQCKEGGTQVACLQTAQYACD